MSGLISRKAAINTVINMRNRCGNDINDFYDLLIESFKVLPSAEPKGRTGRWILVPEIGAYKCSCCGCLHSWPFPSMKYCGECGAKMEVME